MIKWTPSEIVWTREERREMAQRRRDYREIENAIDAALDSAAWRAIKRLTMPRHRPKARTGGKR